MYLYDSRTGALQSQVTTGDWNVLDILEVDESSRTVTVLGNEREAGDPYFQYFYQIDLDDGDVTLLTPDSANHVASFSPDGEYLVDTYSTPVAPPVTVLRDRSGGTLMTLEEAAEFHRPSSRSALRNPFDIPVQGFGDVTPGSNRQTPV